MEFSYLTDRRCLIVVLAMATLILQLNMPTQATAIWPPIISIFIAMYLYRKDMKLYHWHGLKQKQFWEVTFFALTQGMIVQALGIAAVSYGLGIEAPKVSFTLSPIVLLSAIVFSAILEELLYRKIIFSFLDRKFGFWPAAVMSSVLFAVAHYNYAAYLGYFLLGLVWCHTYKKSGNIGVVIAAHMVFNLIAFTAMWLRG